MDKEKVYDVLPEPEKQLILKVKIVSNSKNALTFFQKILRRIFGEQNLRESAIRVYGYKDDPTAFLAFIDISLREPMLQLNPKHSVENLSSLEKKEAVTNE